MSYFSRNSKIIVLAKMVGHNSTTNDFRKPHLGPVFLKNNE